MEPPKAEEATTELNYPEIEGKIAFTCFQFGIEYFPKNYMKGDEIEKHILCRRLLGVSKCAKCGKQTIGLGTIRVHRQNCLAPSSCWGSSHPHAMTQLIMLREGSIFLF